MKRNLLFKALFIPAVLFLPACTHTGVPDALVPPTVIEDERLPSVAIELAGIERGIHFLTFGDNANPPLFIIHASLSGMRAYLPLKSRIRGAELLSNSSISLSKR